jgi:cell division protein FtsB
MARLPAQPGRFRRFFGLKKVLAVNLLAFTVIAWGFSGDYLRNRRMENEISRLQQEAEDLAQKNSDLAELSARFAAGGMLEREARSKLNLRRPGEEVVIVRESEAPKPEETVRAETPRRSDERLTNPQKWWRYFFH